MHNYNQKSLKMGLKTPFNTKITIKSMEDLSFSFGNEIPYPIWHWITQSEWDLKTRYYYQFTLDGVFDTLLYAESRKANGKVEYYFTTQTDGKTTTKSAEGLFNTEEPNDLGVITDKYRKYFNL